MSQLCGAQSLIISKSGNPNKQGCLGQRQKYIASARAMLSGKFLRVRKVFEIRTYFRPTALYLRICLLDFPECLGFFYIFFTASEPSRLLGRFPKNIDWLQTNTPESFQFILSGNFTKCLESFAQYGFLSGNLTDFLEDIQVVWKLSRLS